MIRVRIDSLFYFVDICYVFFFFIIMFNISLYNFNVRDRSFFERFVFMNRGINGGSDFSEE